MILVRNVFKLKFGKAKEVKELWNEGKRLAEKAGMNPQRAMVDVSGDFYTFVLENTYPTLAEWERDAAQGMNDKEWKAWYARFTPLVESGYREIFNLLD